MSTEPKIGLREVAERAGVSVSTASNALRPGPRISFVSEATQKRVIRVAEQMGFRVNSAARSLRSARRYSLAVVCGDLRERAAVVAAESIFSFLSKTDYAGILATCSKVDDLRGYVLRHFDSRSQDAVIFIRDDHLIAPALISSLVRAGLRCAAIMPDKMGLPRIPLACLDRPRAAAMMVEVLAREGHRTIDFVLLPNDSPAIWESANLAASECQVKVRRISLSGEPGQQEAFREGFRIGRGELAKSRASAVAVFSEPLAPGLLQGLLHAGISVPGDRSFLAYGSSALTEASEPRLSLVSHPIEQIGRELAARTIEWIESDFDIASVSTRQYKPEFHPGKSIAAR